MTCPPGLGSDGVPAWSLAEKSPPKKPHWLVVPLHFPIDEPLPDDLVKRLVDARLEAIRR